MRKFFIFAGLLVMAGAATILTTSPTIATQDATHCLRADRGSKTFDYWDNSCSVGVAVTWTDEGGCRGFKCSAYVGAYREFAVGTFKGSITWAACASPGGDGDVVVSCTSSGSCRCRD